MRQHSNGCYRCATLLVALSLGLVGSQAALAQQTGDQQTGDQQTGDQQIVDQPASEQPVSEPQADAKSTSSTLRLPGTGSKLTLKIKQGTLKVDRGTTLVKSTANSAAANATGTSGEVPLALRFRPRQTTAQPQAVNPLQEHEAARLPDELAAPASQAAAQPTTAATTVATQPTTAAAYESATAAPPRALAAYDPETVTDEPQTDAYAAYESAAYEPQTDAYESQPIAYQPGDSDDGDPNGVDEEDLFGDEEPLDESFDESPAGPPADQSAPRTLPDVPVEIQQRPHQAGRGMPFEVLTSSGELTVTRRRNKILRSEHNIYRVAVVDPAICDVVQFTPREVSIIGKAQGATNVTFWFADGSHEPITYLVRVVPDPEVQVERERQYQILEEIVAELFPDSKVRLVPVADKLIVRGQAKGAEEAAQIMAVIRGEAVLNNNGTDGAVVDGRAATPLTNEETGTALPAANVINMLRIPGVQQVALKVKIAELNRSAAREFGIDLDLNFNVGGSGALVIQTLLNMAAGSTTSISGAFDNDDINFGIHYLQSHDVVRILSEPTLVTLSGRPASFLAGGEFAVPTVVGVEGASAIATDFRSFGVLLNFLPTVLDKDRIRLEISPEFSQIDSDLEVDGTPGLNTRAVTTTVEMREGQAFAIAGLLEDSMSSDTVGDLPWLAKLLGRRSVSHNETELLILVTPELVHPLEPEEVPPLPGFDVTEPTNREFFWHGDIEGRPTREYRSTIWPRLRSRYRNGGPAMISGPFGHGQ